jgi:sensor histidine kinase YesM
MISLAAVAGDLPICALTTLLALAAFALHGFLGPLLPTVACFAGSISARGILGRANVYLRGFGSAFVGQGFAVGVRALMGTYRTESLASAPANALGVLVILVILNDARIRARSEQNKLEAERTQTLVREAQLQDLRARIHPHFMFNTLTSIAALCRLDSVKAERSVVALAAILRRALETPGTDQLPLSQEIEHVKNYLEIEQVRWGEKLKIVWRLDESALLDRAPAFCLQTLVENAIIHGGKKVDTLQVRISVFQRGERTRVSVKDNGPGFQETPDLEDSSPVHGLPITNRRLTMIAEQKARLRVFSKAGSGSLVSFSIPHAHEH